MPGVNPSQPHLPRSVIVQMAYTIIAPLVAGQLIQYFLPKAVKWLQEHVNFGKVGPGTRRAWLPYCLALALACAMEVGSYKAASREQPSATAAV